MFECLMNIVLCKEPNCTTHQCANSIYSNSFRFVKIFLKMPSRMPIMQYEIAYGIYSYMNTIGSGILCKQNFELMNVALVFVVRLTVL